MHAVPYGTRLWRARSEPEPSRTGHGALLGVPVALSLAVGTVENVRVCGWLFGKLQGERRTRELCVSEAL